MDDVEGEKTALVKKTKKNDTSYFTCSNRDHTTPSNNVLPLVLILLACSLIMCNMTINQYIYKRLDNNATSETEHGNQSCNGCQCTGNAQQNSIKKKAADLLNYLEVVQFSIVLPLIIITGIYSDIYGRKLVLILGLLGHTIQYVMSFFIVFFDLHLNLFYIPYATSGMFGTYYCVFQVSSASVADITKSGKNRSFQLALLLMYVGLGLCAAQICTGYLIKFAGFSIPFIISAGMCFIAMCLSAFFFKETFHRTDDVTFFRRSILTDLKSYFEFFRKRNYIDGSGKWKVILCLVCYLLIEMPIETRADIEVLYFLGSPFCFSSESIGWFEAVKEFAGYVVGAVFLRILNLFLNDDPLIIIGGLSGVLYFIMLALASDVWMLFVGAGGGLLSTLGMVIFKSLLSKMFAQDKQGIVFANINLLEVIGKLCGTTIFLKIYGSTQPFMKGFAFLVYAFFNFLCILLSIPIIISNRRIRAKESKEIKVVGS